MNVEKKIENAVSKKRQIENLLYFVFICEVFIILKMSPCYQRESVFRHAQKRVLLVIMCTDCSLVQVIRSSSTKNRVL